MFMRRIQLVSRSAVVSHACLEAACRPCVGRSRAHFRRVKRYDRFAGGQKRPGEVASASASVL